MACTDGLLLNPPNDTEERSIAVGMIENQDIKGMPKRDHAFADTGTALFRSESGRPR